MCACGPGPRHGATSSRSRCRPPTATPSSRYPAASSSASCGARTWRGPPRPRHRAVPSIAPRGEGPAPSRVLGADDHDPARWGIAGVGAPGAGRALAGTAGSARQALTLIERTEPAVVTVGTALPDMSGFELVAILRDRYPRMGVVLVLAESDPAHVAAAAERGASGAVTRSASVATLTSVIRAAATEPTTFRAPGEFLRTPARPGPRLSPRERQVLALLVEGRTQAEIAQALNISPATAKTHVARLYNKLQARNRSQALLATAREGLLPLA